MCGEFRLTWQLESETSHRSGDASDMRRVVRAEERVYRAVVRARSGQSRVTSMLVVKRLVILELPFEVALLPKPDSIQILASNSSD